MRLNSYVEFVRPIARCLCAKPALSKREYDREYYLRNKDTRKENSRLYYAGVRNSKSESKLMDQRDYNRQFYLRNQHDVKLSTRRYYLRNKGPLKQSMREYYERNRVKLRQSMLNLYIRNKDNPELYSPRMNSFRSWKRPEDVRAYFETIGKALRISDHRDWYRVSNAQISALGGRYVYLKFESLGMALKYAYPEINWELDRFSLRGKKSGQRWLKVMIEAILPGIEIVEDYQHPELPWDETSRHMELDLWIPKHSIALEYQGEHHFYNVETAFGPNGTTSLYSDRDVSKITICQSKGISLIVIPFWWDGDKGSLAATLYQARPDVFPVTDASPIPPFRAKKKRRTSDAIDSLPLEDTKNRTLE